MWMRMTLRRWEQIFAKLAIGDPLLQILVGGGNDPHIHLHRLVARRLVELAIRQDHGNRVLHVQRMSPYFVENQGAAIGLFEAAVTGVVGAGEGALS